MSAQRDGISTSFTKIGELSSPCITGGGMVFSLGWILVLLVIECLCSGNTVLLVKEEGIDNGVVSGAVVFIALTMEEYCLLLAE